MNNSIKTTEITKTLVKLYRNTVYHHEIINLATTETLQTAEQISQVFISLSEEKKYDEYTQTANSRSNLIKYS